MIKKQKSRPKSTLNSPTERDRHTWGEAVNKLCGDCWDLKSNKARNECRTNCIEEHKQEIFEQWYLAEKARGDWWNILPKCPQKISVEEKTTKNGSRLFLRNIFCEHPEKWEAPKRISIPHVEKFHPGAVYEMRSIPLDGHSNQATFDAEGNLITTAPAMGTVDIVSPRISRRAHWFDDVVPIIVAAELDGMWSKPTMNDPLIIGSLTGLVVPDTAGRIMGVGEHMKKYFAVRPLWY